MMTKNLSRVAANRHAKILATVGPASWDPETLKTLVEAGVDGFRLNFSHGSHEDHAKVFNHIRSLEAERGLPITILQDLQGPKIRVGTFAEDQVLEKGDIFTLDDDAAPGDKTRVHLPHPEILDILQPGDKVFINDGLVRLQVKEKSGKNKKKVECEVLAGGKVSDRKGINLPNVDLPFSALTDKDKKDLAFGLELGVDWVAQSFVQRVEDVRELADLVKGRAAIMAKIEKPNAVARIDQIIDAVDAIMLARGDLGVEMPLEEVPPIQKKLIRLCREAGKPIVVATQMLESMVTNAGPTRAEVSDVANAAYEGADTLMLSAETASGKYPVEAVEMMAAAIERVERSSAWRPLLDARHPESDPTVADAMTMASFAVSEVLEPCAIATFTETGSTALRMARQRPGQPIMVLTPHERTARYLNLVWGLHCRIIDGITNSDDLVEVAARRVQQEGIGKPGETVVVTAGVPFGVPGTTNMVRVITL